MEAIRTLMNEHRLIERVLDSLETFVRVIDEDRPNQRGSLRDYVNFFRYFADKCHHGKEEDLLFVKMNDYGFARDMGPIAVMLAEHLEGRDHVSALAFVGEGSGPLTPDEREKVRHHAGAYIPFLRNHIQKEDNILYPMAQNTIPPSELEKLAGEFEHFESAVMAPGAHAQFHTLAEGLIEAYPPPAESQEPPEG